MEPENRSQQSTSCTEKRKKSEENIKATTSTAVTPDPMHTNRFKIQKVTSDHEIEGNFYENTSKFEHDMNSTISDNKKSNDNIDNEENSSAESDSDEEILKFKDTAYLIMPTVTINYNDVLYNFIIHDERVKKFMLNGEMMDLDIGKDYDPKEIDEIIDHIIIFGTYYYLVKWKNWSKGFNTWECFNNLSNAQRILGDYVVNKTNDRNDSRPINGMHLLLSRKLIVYLFDLFRTEDGISLPFISPDDMSGMFNRLDIGPKKEQRKRKKIINLYLGTISLNSFRYNQLTALKQWEIDINVLSNSYLIKVENNMDLEGPPNSFVYVTKYIPRENVEMSNDPPIGCHCTDNCISSKECCNELSGYSRVYDANKCITIAPGYPIYECNKTCKCTDSCSNRVIQLGSAVRISIYKTKTCGWGIKASQDIAKGNFIAIYSGEIITRKESYKRLCENTSSADYMWNLDFDDPIDYEYVIDASNYSNFTRFINHSCDANLNVYTVWVDCLNRNLHELALFSNRHISAGEQLTFDYFSRHGGTSETTGIRCQCNMKNCRGYYF